MDHRRALAPALLAAAALIAAGRKLSDPDLPWHMAVGRELLEGRWPARDPFSYTFAGTWVPYEYASALLLALAPQAVGAAAIALLAWLLYKRAGLAGAALALAALGPFLIARPALLGLACWAAVLWRPTLWLQVVWANVHGFAIVGAAAAWLRGNWRWALAATAATCLSAFGPAIYLGPFKVLGHAGLIAEWAPSSLELFTTYNPALGLFTLLVLWSARRDPLVLALFAAALLRHRMTPLFVVAAAPYIRLPPALAGAIAIAALALRPEASLGLGWDPARLPVAAAEWVEKNRPQGRVYNDLHWGGWLIWRLREKVFVDGRTAHLYPAEFLKSLDRFADLDKEWDFRWAFIDARRDHLELAVSDGWTMVYADDLAAVYVKGKPKDGYRVLKHVSPWWLMEESGFDPRDIAADAARAARQAPGSRRALLWRAGAALAARDYEELDRAIRALERARPRDPDLPALERALVIR